VLGEFITEGEGALVSLAWLEAARAGTAAAEGPVVVGVDCAASTAGDESVIAVVQGNGVRELVALRTDDPVVLTARVIDVVRKYRPQRVRVDAAGVGTAVVANLYRVPQLGAAVERVWFGGAPVDQSRFANLRAEMHWRLRERLEAGTLAIGRDERLVADLSVLRYAYTKRGQVQLESKDEARRRLGRSPDRSDALCLALGAIGPPRGPSRIYRTTDGKTLLPVVRPDGSVGYREAPPEGLDMGDSQGPGYYPPGLELRPMSTSGESSRPRNH